MPANLPTRDRVLFKVISVASAADNAIVAAVTGKRIRVLSYVIVSAGAVSVTWKSATTPISGAMPLVASSGVAAESQAGFLQTTVSEALNLTLNAAIQVSGHLTYELW